MRKSVLLAVIVILTLTIGGLLGYWLYKYYPDFFIPFAVIISFLALTLFAFVVKRFAVCGTNNIKGETKADEQESEPDLEEYDGYDSLEYSLVLGKWRTKDAKNDRDKKGKLPLKKIFI